MTGLATALVSFKKRWARISINAWPIAYIAFMPVILSRGLIPWGPLDGKVQLAELVFLGWLISTLVLAVDRSDLVFPALWWCFAFYGLAVLLSGIGASRWSANVLLEMAATLYELVLAFLIYQVARTKAGLKHIVQTWVWVATVVAGLGIVGMGLAWFGLASPFVREYPNIRLGSWRLTATMPLPNMAYAYFHWSWFLAFALLLTSKNSIERVKRWVPVVLIGLAIIGTMSRGAAAAGVSLWVLLWQWPSWRKARWIIGAAVLAVFVYAQIFVTWTYDLQVTARTGTTTERRTTSEQAPSQLNIASAQSVYPEGTPFSTFLVEVSYLPTRYFISKRLAWRLFRSHPILGIGPGNFPLASMEAWKPSDPPEQKNIVISADPHSTYFGALAEEGLVGFSAIFLLFAGFVIALIRRLRRGGLEPLHTQLAWAGIAGLAGYAIFAMNVDVMNFRFLWVILGVLAAVLEQRPTVIGPVVEIEPIHYSGKERKDVRHLD